MSQQVFQITLGPVQSFVTQARRTRDFWAGSFILSWLSGVAMKEVLSQGGQIDFPEPEHHFMAALSGEPLPLDKLPQQGGIPNRFRAVSATVDADFDPTTIVQSIQAAWQTLAYWVWQQEIVPGLSNMEPDQFALTEAIWNRQIEHFWEISWVISQSGERDANLLQRRKNLRHHFPPAEPGVKCMMLDGYQELSGAPTPNRGVLNTFWDKISQNLTDPMDLRQGEYLCAPALVKRLFTRVFKDIQVDRGEWQAHGWSVKHQVPSVYHVAACHWLEQRLMDAKTNTKMATLANALYTEASNAGYSPNERNNELRCLQHISQGQPQFKELVALDGEVFFADQLQSKDLLSDRQQQNRLVRALSKFRQGGPQPSPFFSVLLMDGDSLGSQMGDPNKQKTLTQALLQFTANVQAQVNAHNGFLIYAGGDDVLAMLPVEDALACATAIHKAYDAAFSETAQRTGVTVDTSISAAVVYSHVKTPLTQTLQRAHALLDDVAKDQTGRNAIAVEVWKPGGRHLQWSQPWAWCLEGDRLMAETLAQAWQDDSNAMSNQFLQRCIALVDRLNMAGIDEAVLRDLITAEYLHSGKQFSNHSESLMATLMKLFKPVNDGGYQTDALKLVRFLVQKGANA